MMHQEICSDPSAGDGLADDFSRDVYCFLGFPVDAVDMASALRRIERAAAGSPAFFLSTPNLNYLANSQSDPEFRESLLMSDLCIADGVSIVWAARLMGIPIPDRVAGSDVLAEFKARRGADQPLKLFLFGGPEGVAAAAARALNAAPGGVRCVGSLYPGFGGVEDLSGDDAIEAINASGADFLAISLGSKKGQLWLKRNHGRLRVPVRAHLGAALNFEAGSVKRAPRVLRRCGLEWLWRIKEEPFLWRRYWHDGKLFARLMGANVLPLAWRRLRLNARRDLDEALVTEVHGEAQLQIRISGYAIARNADKIVPAFRNAAAMKKRTIIDLSNARAIDARVLGLILMLRKALKGSAGDPVLVGLSADLRRTFRLNGMGFLLATDPSDQPLGRLAGNPNSSAFRLGDSLRS